MTAAHAPRRHAETEAQRQLRLARESKMIDEALADIEAGLFIADEDVDAWLDSFEAGDPLPMPIAPRK